MDTAPWTEMAKRIRPRVGKSIHRRIRIMSVEVKAKKVKLSGGGYRVLWRTEVADGETDLPVVNLSKHPKRCMFTIDAFASHDSHAGTHSTDEAADAYIARVRDDVVSAMSAYYEARKWQVW
jgi:hypothetical protein